MNLGIDFGSTYSMFSIYDEKNDSVKALELTEGGSKYIPSIACVDYDDNLITGQQAKSFLSAQHDLQPYRAFKMLLADSDPGRLKARGYTEDITPRSVSKAFLQQHMELALNEEKQFEHVVICVPEVWNRDILNMGGKTVLRDICMEIGLTNKVTVVSEPAAASAYFAYNYKKQNGKNFNGYILIIDYGGGTLDITLTHVDTVTREDGTNAIEIDACGQAGAGENHPDQVGDAGIAYMEGVVRLALKDEGLLSGGKVPKCDGFFLSTVNMLESALMNKSGQIADALQDCITDPESLADDQSIFVTLQYRGRKLPIRMSTLYRGYQQIIQPVLDRQLNEIFENALSPLQIDPTKPGQKNLKIALVGGFGKYVMVQQQVYEKYHISVPYDQDSRLEKIGLENRESAISYGAALIANGVVTMRKTAKQSIGLVSTLNGRETFDYAIMYHQDLQYNTVYYIRDNPDPKYPERDIIPFKYAGSEQGNEFSVKFAIGIDGNSRKAYKFTPVREIRRILGTVPDGTYAYGFSMDDSGVYTFHICPVVRGRITGDVIKFELGSFSAIFGNNVRIDEKNVLRK